jgi:hypothetical protein
VFENKVLRNGGEVINDWRKLYSTYAVEFDRGGAWGKWETCIRNGSEYLKGSE